MKIEISSRELAQLLTELTNKDPHDSATSLAVERLTDVTRLVLREERRSARYLRRMARDTGYVTVTDDEVETDDEDEEDLTESERLHEDEWS